MKTSFMQPAKAGPGGKLVGKGRLIHRTRTMAFTEATIYDPAGRACAHATGTFKYVSRPPPAAGDGQLPSDPPLPAGTPIATD